MNLIQQDKLPLGAILVTLLTTFLARHHLSDSIPETLFQYPRAANLLYQFRYSVAAILIYLFFLLISRTDRNRSRQLRAVGLYDLLRYSAVFFCAYLQLIVVGQALNLIAPDVHLLPGALSLLVLGVGIQGELLGTLDRFLYLIGAAPDAPARQTFTRGMCIAGLLGLLGIGYWQLLWLSMPLILTPIVTRLRHPRPKGPNA